MIWAKNHINHFPNDADYLNAASVEVLNDDEKSDFVPIDQISASFSPQRQVSADLISSDHENDMILRDREIRGSKRNRDLSDIQNISIRPGIDGLQ